MAVKNRGKAGVPRWHYKFMYKGAYYTGVLHGATDEAKAKEMEEKVRAQVVLGLYGKKEPGSGDFCEFVDTVFLRYSEANKETYKHDKFRCETLKGFFAGRRFCDITPMLVTGYVNERLKSTTVRKEVLEDGAAVNKRRSPTTVRKEVVLLSSIFNMAINEGQAVTNPCRNLPKHVRDKIPARNKRERFLAPDEEERLFEVGLTGPREHLRPLVRLALNTGARRGSLLALRREHINLGAGPRLPRPHRQGCEEEVRDQAESRAVRQE